MEKLFEIENLTCTYNNAQEDVLKIDSLAIEKGSITAIIGSSGVGKSTLLEALSLMNNTIKSGTITYHDENNHRQELSSLWKGNQNRLIHYRKNHFSFIFQTPFLMEDYLVEENLFIPKYLQQTRHNSEWTDEIYFLLKSLTVSEKQLEFPNKLSFGQRQRISFAYALLSKFNVLFGDEPTGSLDNINARLLLDKLKQTIKSLGKSAILVSHDIPLMEKIADVGIFLAKKDANYAEVERIERFNP
jgi:putative ABC transport system ATP-binding protein